MTSTPEPFLVPSQRKLASHLGISPQSLGRMIEEDDDFPQPRQLPGIKSAHWILDEVQTHIRNQPPEVKT